MELTYAEFSSAGPVRPKNEDSLGFCQSGEEGDPKARGAVAVLADGVAGCGRGEVASRLALEAAVQTFRDGKPGAPARQLLTQMFNAANLAVFDRSIQGEDQGPLATTLTISLFRNDNVTVGHVGDCRVYLIKKGEIRLLTKDHTYAGLQVKMGLISPEEAMTSSFRYVLTRSLGQEPFIRIDLESVEVAPGDFLVQCSDGLHGSVTSAEILQEATHYPPEEACRRLVALAERRGSDDNISVQVARIEKVERVLHFRGSRSYQEVSETPASSDGIRLGEILDGRFRIEEMINQGGMSSIYKAIDLTTDHPVAIKVPMMRFESDPGFFSRFQREEGIGMSLDHPSILHYWPVEEKSRPYIVMEYLEGQTLSRLLHIVKRLPVPDALRIASRICDALEYMHRRNVVHRDLKPQNIMICNDGTMRIMDFGISKALGQKRITFAGLSSAMGTPDYMAPEQVKGKSGDSRTDVYSMGAILYEMVTGSTPFEGANAFIVMNARLTGDPVAPRKLNPQIPPQVEEIILHAMERDPAQRYPTAQAMKAELDSPVSVQLTGRHQRLQAPRAWKIRWRRVRVVLISVAAVLIAFGLLLLASRMGCRIGRVHSR
jgi:serine/threonine protein phosphatase PrpC